MTRSKIAYTSTMASFTLICVFLLPLCAQSLELSDIQASHRAMREAMSKSTESLAQSTLKTHRINLPKNPDLDAHLISRWTEDLDGVYEKAELGAATLVCGDDCFSSEVRNLSLSQAQSSLAYQVLNDDGIAELIDIEIDDQFVDYVNKWNKDDREMTDRAPSRKRREVLEDDTRFTVYDKEWLNQIPFSATVRVGTVCSGVLISEHHVLTAASCVHDGRRYIERLKDIRIGVRQKRELTYAEENGDGWKETFRWHPVQQVFIPAEWSRTRIAGVRRRQQPPLPLEKNYAVIELKRKLDRGFLNISVGSVANVAEGQRIHFSSFDDPQSPMLNYRFCRVKEETMEILYQECDSTDESQGAGVYVRQWDNEARDWNRKVVAIFGGFKMFYNNAGVRVDRNIAVKLTPLKFAQICFWMTGDYGKCRG